MLHGEKEMSEEYAQETRKIVLRWKAATFLPNLLDCNDVDIIRETIYPTAFEREADINRYWSVPERLIDIRWVMELQSADSEENLGRRLQWREKYGELEYLLYRMVTTLGRWAWFCERSISCVAKDVADMNSVLMQTWQEHEQFLREFSARGDATEPSAYTKEDLDHMGRLAEVFSALSISDDRKGGLRASAKRLYDLIVSNYGKIQDQLNIFDTPAHDEVQTIYAEMLDFSKKAVDFFDNSLWRKASAADQELDQVEQNIRKALPKWKPEGEKLTQAYFASIWKGMQMAADKACDIVNVSGNRQVTTVGELLKQVKDALELLGIGVKRHTKQWKDYVKDEGRCIALLELKNGKRYLAFSGFLDCEDLQAQSVLKCPANTEIIDDFRRISQYFHAALAIHSSDVVDKMTRYKVGKDCKLRQFGPMRTELPPDFDENQANIVKKAYSCCERKILAEIEAQGGVQNTLARLFVKFEPCLKCYGALNNWMDKNGIIVDLDYPPN